MINVSYLCHWIKWERSFIQPLPIVIISAGLLIWEKKEEEQKKKNNPGNEWRCQDSGPFWEHRNIELLFTSGIICRSKCRWRAFAAGSCWPGVSGHSLEALGLQSTERRGLFIKGLTSCCMPTELALLCQQPILLTIRNDVPFGGEIPCISVCSNHPQLTHLTEKSVQAFEQWG